MRRLARSRGGLAKGIAVAIAAVLLAIGGGMLLKNLATGGSGPGPSTAVIVDQLSLTQPNPEFVASATGLLEQAGYVVDYYPGEQVTVDFYRDLPTMAYDIILLRVHAGITTETELTSGSTTETEYVSLFTGEPYDPAKYVQEQLGRLGKAAYYEGAEPLFGIAPEFIEESMKGGFDDALVIMMGCDGLRSQRTAQAFLDRGASAFVSWSKPVSAAHTDATTEHLLESLLMDSLTIGDAVRTTAVEVGPDPTYGAELRMLPVE